MKSPKESCKIVEPVVYYGKAHKKLPSQSILTEPYSGGMEYGYGILKKNNSNMTKNLEELQQSYNTIITSRANDEKNRKTELEENYRSYCQMLRKKDILTLHQRRKEIDETIAHTWRGDKEKSDQNRLHREEIRRLPQRKYEELSRNRIEINEIHRIEERKKIKKCIIKRRLLEKAVGSDYNKKEQAFTETIDRAKDSLGQTSNSHYSNNRSKADCSSKPLDSQTPCFPRTQLENRIFQGGLPPNNKLFITASDAFKANRKIEEKLRVQKDQEKEIHDSFEDLNKIDLRTYIECCENYIKRKQLSALK